jgi:hypothetical protein
MNRAAPFFLLPVLLVGATGCGSVVIIDSSDGPDGRRPPKIVDTSEALIGTTTEPGRLFTAKAEDPQGSELTFSWKATIGTLKSAKSSENSSSVPWFGPPCLTPGPDPAVIVTVTNAFSLSDTAKFAVSSIPPCPMPQDPFPPPIPGGPIKVWNKGGEVDTWVVPDGQSVAQFFLWGGGGGGGAPASGGGGAWVGAQFLVKGGDKLEVRVASGGAAQGGGGGASYVLRNGEIMVVAAGGGGGGVDGCSGCSKEEGPQGGLGGAGGPAGGAGQNGQANNYYKTNSGGGVGGSQSGGGTPGITKDQSGATTCASNGKPGAENQGGRAVQCDGPAPEPAKGHLGGGGIGNGSGGGGGSGRFGGGGGAAKYTYTGGGGGGGESWIHPDAKLIGTEGGDGQAPGGSHATGYQNNAGRGGIPGTGPFGTPSTPGAAGLITMTL